MNLATISPAQRLVRDAQGRMEDAEAAYRLGLDGRALDERVERRRVLSELAQSCGQGSDL